MRSKYKRVYEDEHKHPDFHLILRYEEISGKFYWIKRASPARGPGEEAGTVRADGGIMIQYKNQSWHASRLAWYFTHGSFPSFFIDHINGNRGDNRISNLREVTERENNQNKKIHRTGRLVGASKRYGRWRAQLQINYKKVNLGTFDTEQEASNKYWEAISKLDEARKE